MPIMEDYGSSDDNCYSYEYDDDDDNSNSSDFQDPEVETQFLTDRAPSSKVITKASLLAAQKEDLHRVMDLLSLKEHHARTLLIHYRWDVDKIFTVFVEKGKDKLYADACITMEEHDGSLSSPSKAIFCEICMEEVPGIETTQMECGHCFCNNCWAEHFIVKINEGQSRHIRCMAYKCNAICEEGKIFNLVEAKDPNFAEKFTRFLLESYIEDNKWVKWCPSVPHCGNAIYVDDGDEYCEVECACGEQFCFSCLCKPHSPCSCQIWKLWIKRVEDEFESVDWITENTKNCPNCEKPVQKNGGCNVVRCICGVIFCWTCGELSNAYMPHNCGIYNDEHEKERILAKIELRRYSHYLNRFRAHTDSLKLEVKMKEKMEAKISTLKLRESVGPRDFEFLLNGFYRLLLSRRILLCTYPFAYIMFGEHFRDEIKKKEVVRKKNLFEDQQQQLEANVERLSMILEEPFDGYSDDRVMEMSTKVIDLDKLIDNLCKKLYECVENDLLGALRNRVHVIAPYRSKGVEKAEEIHGYGSTNNGMINLAGLHI